LAHPQQLDFLKQVISLIPSNVPIKMLDLGSLDINGGIKSFIPQNCHYLGVDLELGPNVDLAREAQLLDLESEQFDFSISSELFEHTPYWREIFAQMCRLTKPGGVVAFTCAGAGRPEHGTTRSDNGYASPFTVSKGDEYYGNVARCEANKAVALKYWFTSYDFFEEFSAKDLYFVGIRSSNESSDLIDFKNLLSRLNVKYPKNRLKLRYWTLRLLPFAWTDITLRVLQYCLAKSRTLLYPIKL